DGFQCSPGSILHCLATPDDEKPVVHPYRFSRHSDRNTPVPCCDHRTFPRRELLLPLVAASRPLVLRSRPRCRVGDPGRHIAFRFDRIRSAVIGTVFRLGHFSLCIFAGAETVPRKGCLLGSPGVEPSPDFSSWFNNTDTQWAFLILLGGGDLHLLASD